MKGREMNAADHRGSIAMSQNQRRSKREGYVYLQHFVSFEAAGLVSYRIYLSPENFTMPTAYLVLNNIFSFTNKEMERRR